MLSGLTQTKVSRTSSDVKDKVNQKLIKLVGNGAPTHWFPKVWIAFILGGRPAGTMCFLSVGSVGNRRTIDENALVALTESGNKSNRRLGRESREFLLKKKEGEHSSPSAEDEVIILDRDPSNTSPNRGLKPHQPSVHRYIEVMLKKEKQAAEENVSKKYSIMLASYQASLDILDLQRQDKPDDNNVLTQIEKIRKRKLKLLALQQKEMAATFGFDDIEVLSD